MTLILVLLALALIGFAAVISSPGLVVFGVFMLLGIAFENRRHRI